MMLLFRRIRVHVSGCIENTGWIELKPFSGIGLAIMRAGGVRGRDLVLPSGLVTVVRKIPRTNQSKRLLWRFHRPVRDARGPVLTDLDMIIVQFGSGLYRNLRKPNHDFRSPNRE